MGEGEWQVRKHGASRRRQWRKIHIGINADTLGVRTVEMTGNRIGDAPVLPDLLAQIPAKERIGSVTADGIYDAKGCHAAIAARGADPSYRLAEMPEPGRDTIRDCDHAMKHCVPASALAGPRNGPDTTDEA